MTTDQVRLATAGRSRSSHNPQPWLCTIDGDAVHVRADRRRQLPRCDPRGREPVLSCGDEAEDWARARAALVRGRRTATAEGSVARPRSGVLEIPALRSRLVAELGLVGRPQLPLRVGCPSGPGSAPTGRRPVSAVRVACRVGHVTLSGPAGGRLR